MRQIQAGRLRRYRADVNAGERWAACRKCRQVSAVVRGQSDAIKRILAAHPVNGDFSQEGLASGPILSCASRRAHRGMRRMLRYAPARLPRRVEVAAEHPSERLP
ncbi:hypothetical protein RPHASCH2410_PD00080 (plasmid) [Rhizobium phaseoli Ch24-10]|nr:hypothetical protein RPHASCH2410_PD00080 [Rhizobium phaseoli Ch24-10]